MTSMSTSSTPSHHSFLKTHTVADILNSKSSKKRLLFRLTAAKTIEDGLRFFAKHHIHAAPIESSPRTMPPKFDGIVSLTDLLLPLISNPSMQMIEAAADDRLRQSSIDQFKDLLETFFQHPVRSYMGVTATQANQSNADWTISSNTSILDALDTFQNVRYALVTDRHALIKDDFAPLQDLSTSSDEEDARRRNSITSMDMDILDQSRVPREDRVYFISHWDVISYLGKHLDELGSLVNQSLIDLKVVSSERQLMNPLETIDSNTSALSGFHKMFRDKQHIISALPVVNKNGKLTGNLSATDVGIISPDCISSLLKPVDEFAKDMHEIESRKLRSPSGKDDYDRMSYIFIVTAQPTDAFGPVVKRLCESRVHRVWVCDSQQHPLGVVSMSDAINLFSRIPA